MDFGLAEYGILGVVATIAISGMIFMFKKYHTVQEARIKEKQIHTDQLLNYLDKMLNSNASVRELITNNSITDKGAVISAIDTSSSEIRLEISKIKPCNVQGKSPASH